MAPMGTYPPPPESIPANPPLLVWGYVKSRETARRMDAYAGEVQSMHPFYAYDSPARAKDMDLLTTKAVRTSPFPLSPFPFPSY